MLHSSRLCFSGKNAFETYILFLPNCPQSEEASINRNCNAINLVQYKIGQVLVALLFHPIETVINVYTDNLNGRRF